MADRILSLRELNRATLARQLLLERRRLSAKAVIERLVGVQAQLPQSPYIGIWTRTTSFRRETLERELRRGAIVKATVMRQTLHLVTRRDYALLRAALSETNFPDQSEQATRLAPSARAFASKGTVTTAEVLAYFEAEHGLAGFDALRAWRGARVRAHILHHHETALWRAASGRPVRRSRRAGGARSDGGPRGDAPPLPRRVRTRDAAGHRRLEHDARARDRAGARAARAAAPLPGRAGPRAPRRPAGAAPRRRTPAPVRLLPKWDNVLLSWADRTRILPEEYRKAVIRMNGDVAPTFLVDGFVAGTWRVEGERVLAEPFEPLPRAARREVADEAARLTAFLTATH